MAQKNINYNVDIGAAPQVAQPNYGQLSSALIKSGQDIGQASITQGKAIAGAVETGGKMAWGAKVGYDQAQFENQANQILSQVGTPSELQAQSQQPTIFQQPETTPDNVTQADSKFSADANRYVQAREQGLISASEAANRITALAKERIAAQPWAAADIRQTTARLTGIQNVEARDFQRALTLEEKAQKAAEKAREFELKGAEEIYNNLPMLFPDMNPAQIADTLAADPKLRKEVMTMAAQRRSIDAAATNSDRQVKLMTNQGTLTSQAVDQNLAINTAKVVADQIPLIKQFVTDQKINPATYSNTDGSTNYQAISGDKAKLEILQSQLNQTFAAHYLKQHAQIDTQSGLTPDQRANMHKNLADQEKRTQDMFKNLSGVATQVALLEKYNYDVQKFSQNAQAWNQITTSLGDANARLQFMLDPQKVQQSNPQLYQAMQAQNAFITSAVGINPKLQSEQANVNVRNGVVDPATAAASVPREALASETVIQNENRKLLINKYVNGTTSPEEQVKDARSLAYGIYFANYTTTTGKQELDVLINGGQLQSVLKNMTPENGAMVVEELHKNIRRSLSYNEGNLSQRIVAEYQQIDKLYKETSKEGLQMANDASGNLIVKYPNGNVKGNLAAQSSSLDSLLKTYNDLSMQSRIVANQYKGQGKIVDAAQEARDTVTKYLQGSTPAKPQELQQQSFNQPAAVVSSLWNKVEQQESGGKQSAVSPKGAVGVAQVMPTTAPEAAQLAGLPWDEKRYREDATYNRQLGQAYLKKQIETFGDPAKALAAYNAGPGATQEAVRKAQQAGKPDQWLSYLPKETRDYVKAILT